jgi:hypothetical protein
MKVMQTVTAKKNVVDVQGWTIPKGTEIHVMKVLPKHPSLGYRVLVVRIDNGTGSFDLMPETAIRDTDLDVKIKEAVEGS